MCSVHISCSTCDTHHAVHFNYRLRFTHDETSREKKKGRTYNQYEPNTSAFIRDTANWWRWSFKYTSEPTLFVSCFRVAQTIVVYTLLVFPFCLCVGWPIVCSFELRMHWGIYSPYEDAAGIVLYRNGIFTIGKCTPSIFRSQTTLTVNFSGYRTWCEALLADWQHSCN
jgi:hypothetical protein